MRQLDSVEGVAQYPRSVVQQARRTRFGPWRPARLRQRASRSPGGERKEPAMKKLLVLLAVALVAGLGAFGKPGGTEARVLPPENYKCYQVRLAPGTAPLQRQTVLLSDQFELDKEAQVLGLTGFCNAVIQQI